MSVQQRKAQERLGIARYDKAVAQKQGEKKVLRARAEKEEAREQLVTAKYVATAKFLSEGEIPLLRGEAAGQGAAAAHRDGRARRRRRRRNARGGFPSPPG